MEISLIIEVFCAVLLPVIGGVVVYFVTGKDKEKARKAYELLKAESENNERILTEIANYFDPETPYCNSLSLDTQMILDDHPYSFKLEDSDLDLIRSTCKDTEEYTNILEQIHSYESMYNVDYTIKTTGAKFRIYYGSAILIEEKTSGLSQMSINEMTNINGGKDTFLILYTILENEREKKYEYDINLANCIIHVKGGEYMIEAVKNTS